MHDLCGVSTGDTYSLDGKLSASSNRHSPKSSLPVTLLKLGTYIPTKLTLIVLTNRSYTSSDGSVLMTGRLQMDNYLHPATDTLLSQTCQSLSKSLGWTLTKLALQS